MQAPSGFDTGTSCSLSHEGASLLAPLESSRDLLARRLVREYHEVADPDLNYLAVTPLLQILFLRACQECGISSPDTLSLLAGCDGIAKRMGRACSDAGLISEKIFAWGPQGAREIPAVPDEPLRGIIRQLDEPDLPVPLSGLPLDELAAVLDQFLGTRLQVGEGYRVVRAGKSALLYTGTVDVPPQEVVEYAVQLSTGPGGGGSRCQILDPACGAGLFLLAAFRNLAGGVGNHESREVTIARLQEILCGSVFGTDIDPESVSAARVILLLAFLDESRKAGAGTPAADEIRQVCDCLTGTIRCGNALIAPDYFTGKPVFPFNAEERRRVNAFDWQAAFPEVTGRGGFDAVIGAPPPYRPFATKAREEYFQTHYDAYAVSAGLYGYFIEQGLRLVRPGGTIAFLVPGTFLRSQHARPLRRLLLSRQIGRIACTKRTRPLPEGETPVYLLTLKNQPPADPFTVSPDFFPGRHDFRPDQRLFDDGGWRLEDTRAAAVLERIRGKGTPLEEYVMGEIGTGTHAARNNPLVVDQKTRNLLTKNAWWARRHFIPLLCPADIRRYVPVNPSRFVLTGTGSKQIRNCRALREYVTRVQEIAAAESETIVPADEAGPAQEHDRGHFLPEKPVQKIIFAPCQERPAFCLDYKGRYALTDSLVAILRNDPFLVAVLNSGLGRFVIMHTCPYSECGYDLSPSLLGKFPVIVPDFEQFSDKKRYDKITALVSQLISLQEYLLKTRTDQERRLVQQEIDATDVRIDALVYELYGLTPEEIAVVESSVRG